MQNADVAQLVEQRFRKPQVTGSNPVVGSLLSQKHFTNENHREFQTLNEEENIMPLVSQITACAVPFREILFVDDHSTDVTRDKIQALGGSQPIRLIEQDGAGPGLAGAIMSGARRTRRNSSCDGRRPESSG
jgi:hypothetical protein